MKTRSIQLRDVLDGSFGNTTIIFKFDFLEYLRDLLGVFEGSFVSVRVLLNNTSKMFSEYLYP